MQTNSNTSDISLRSIKRLTAIHRNSIAGFTLIELMIVVVVVALLAAIAFPTYRKQVLASNRTSAKSALLDISSREEKYYAINNTYTTQLTNLGYASVNNNTISVPGNGTTHYSVTITTNPASGATSGSTYIATASAVSPQTNDSCGNFSMTNLGVQTASGTTTNGSCW